MNAARSVIFNFFYLFGSLAISIFMLWALVLPHRKCAEIVGTVYSGYVLWAARVFMGLKLEMRGLENLPKDQNFIIAAKHQSAFETVTIPFMKIFSFPAIILKKELTYIPVWGLYPMRMGQVPIDRSAGKEAINLISAGCRKALDDKRNIIIFPQGTRIRPGVSAPYKPGLAKIYKDLKVPIVPLALNTGVFWGKNAFFKKPGTIVYEFLPPIPAGEPPLKMMEKLERDLEAVSEKLRIEAESALQNPA